jgi:hypothetical protein
MQAEADGVVDTVQLLIQRVVSGTSVTFDYLKYTLANAQVLGVKHTGAKGGLDFPTEDVTFSYQTLTYTFSSNVGLQTVVLNPFGGRGSPGGRSSAENRKAPAWR